MTVTDRDSDASGWFADLYVSTGRDGFCPVVSGRSFVGLARGSRAAFGLAFPGYASRLAADCGPAQQRRDTVVVLEVGMPTAVL
jgi:hypothetical protein